MNQLHQRTLTDLSVRIQFNFQNAVYGPPLTISATANTNCGRSNIDSAFLGQGCL
jgi:hypothetical protein